MTNKENLPNSLYKYQPYASWSIKNLEKHSLWFSKPHHFNDPYDCSINLNTEDISEDQWLKLYRYYKENMKERFSEEDIDSEYLENGIPNNKFRKQAISKSIELFSDYESTLLNERGVACFSEKVDEMLMWSHYTNGHRGFCVEFDTNYEPFNDKQRIFQVNYSKSIPTINPIEIMMSKSIDSLDPMMKMLATKSDHWSYENEWRIFHMDGDFSYELDPNAISGIYFGCLMPIENKRKIASIFRDSSTHLFEMHKHDHKFRIYSKLI